MFAKLKKKIAEEAATAPRPGGAARIPRSVSKESITSVGADSGDDFPSDGSSSREDLSSQLFRRNEQIRKLEVKLSDYAEQVRNLQKIKEKLEIALEKHQDASLRKLQEQNEAHQASRAKMAEGMALTLEKKDQEWRERLSFLENERKMLTAQLQEMRDQSLNLFKKRDDHDELEGFQQQELAKVKHMLLKKEEFLGQMEIELKASKQELFCTQEDLKASNILFSRLSAELQELRQQHANLKAERDELLDAKKSANNKITILEQQGHELEAHIQEMSVELQNTQVTASSYEKTLETLQAEHESLKLNYEQDKQKMTVEMEEKSQLIGHLQGKLATLEKRLEENLSGDEHAQELLQEKSALEQQLESAQQQLSAAQASHAESVSLLETQAELNSRETVSVEIAKALEEAGKHKEDLQQQVADLTLLLKEKDGLILDKMDTLQKKEEELKCIKRGYEELQLQMQQLKTDLELCHKQAAENEAVMGKQMSTLQKKTAGLELASKALKKQLHSTEVGKVKPNGEVAATDVVQLQKENRELKKQIAEKNKMIRQLQQRMAELKKTLQKELKIQPDREVPEAHNAALTVTNNSDLSDYQEKNFEYLKHVVLKFMSCRESEAFHLIKAVSVLLNFSQEEESMLRETLEYKRSWFGSKPSPRGSIRPSISNPRTPWL
ncbi:golgin subfamily A member 1 isoform X2 [Paroedura picta]|uniref:golgin subfamily A member 1 isoform X2 n=1 Tax=Paroedura picta TaxID=143630 RepID=UPI00405635E5